MKQYPWQSASPSWDSWNTQPTTSHLVNTLQPTTHERFIKQEYLDYIRLWYQGKYLKTVELRPDTSTYNTVKPGDIIKFSSGWWATCTVRVTEVKKTEKSIEQTLAELTYDEILAIMPDLKTRFAPKNIASLRTHIQQLAQTILTHTYHKNALLIHFEVDNLI